MRKLATAALSYSAAVFMAQYLFPEEWLPYAAACFVLAALAAKALKGGLRLRVLLITISAAAGMLWSWGHYELFIAPSDGFDRYDTTVEARVTGFPEKTAYYSKVRVRVLNDELPNVTMNIYAYGEELELSPGDIISVDARLRTATRYHDEETGRYSSKGVYLLGYKRGELTLTGRSAFSFIYFPKYLAKIIGDEITRAFPEDVSGLIKALLTGDKTEFYDDAELSGAMARSGIAHTVSVSGMHVAFLIGFIRTLTRRRRQTALIGIPVIVVFVLMSGASPSAVRAGFMQAMFLLAPMFGRENDSPTSLSVILAMLLIQNPAAAMSISLQLSFSAVAGILLITPYVNDKLTAAVKKKRLYKNEPARRVLRFVISGFASTVGAIAFSTPLAALHFGYVSLASPLTNLLTLPVVSFCFTAGFVVCAVGLIVPFAGTALAWALAWPLRYVAGTAKLIAAFPYAAVYTANNYIAWWLVLVYVFFGVSYLYRKRGGVRIVIPVCLSAITLCGVILFTAVIYDYGEGRVAVLNVGQGQSIAIMAGSSTVVIDCGGNETVNAGSAMADYLMSRNRFSIDLLVLTHLHDDHVSGVMTLLSRMNVRRIALPLGADDPEGILPKIEALAQSRGTEILCVADDSLYLAGRISLNVFAPIGAGAMNERGLIIHAAIGEFGMLVTGDADEVTERGLLKLKSLPKTELLIAGHHGSKRSTSDELLDAAAPQAAVISSGYNTYGHPASETLSRLYSREIAIYRTDLHGNVEIVLANSN